MHLVDIIEKIIRVFKRKAKAKAVPVTPVEPTLAAEPAAAPAPVLNPFEGAGDRAVGAWITEELAKVTSRILTHAELEHAITVFRSSKYAAMSEEQVRLAILFLAKQHKVDAGWPDKGVQ